jgi:hypothetical protein
MLLEQKAKFSHAIFLEKKINLLVVGGLSSPAAYLPITPLHLKMHDNI